MEHQGFCGFTPPQCAGGAGVCTGQSSMSLSITSTTGSPVELTVPRGETLEDLRSRISQKLRLQTDRMELVHRDRHLTAGKLSEQGVRDGSKLTLVPVIEACSVCSTAREMTVMDKLDSLTDTQINDFLSGRSPLALCVGTGVHTMYVQLQLSQDVKKLLEDEDSQVQGGCELTPDDVSHPDSSATGFMTSQTPSLSSLSDASPLCSTLRPRSSPHHPAGVSPVSCLSPSSLLHHAPPSPSGFPHFSCPRRAATPVCSGRPTGSTPEPLSPAAASTLTEHDGNAHLSKQPGAVIESLVSHSPDVFSGTFSGNLVPYSQRGISHPRRGIAVILQILNDLLRAACHHKGALTPPPPAPPPPHLCAVANLPVSREKPCKTRNRPLLTQRTKLGGDESQLLVSSLEENKRMRCKLEHLQLLMRRSRLRRRTRGRSHLHQVTRPHCSWCSGWK